MSQTPLVSVLIRTRNRPELLQEALASVAQQGYRPLQVLAVNDRGDDHSHLLSGFAAQDLSLQWLENSVAGRSGAANTALEAASGEYCIFLDDDDLLDPDHIGNLVAELQSDSTLLLAYSAVRTLDENGQCLESAFAQPYDRSRLLIENYIPIHAALFSRSLIDSGCRFDNMLEVYEDWDFWLQAAALGNFRFTQNCSATYRIGGGSGFGVRQHPRQQEQRLMIYRKWLPRISDEELLELLGKAREFPRLAVLKSELQGKDEYLTHLQETERDLREKLQIANLRVQDMMELESTLEQTRIQLDEEKQLVISLREELQIIYNSRSWKLTKPLRLLHKIHYFYRLEGLAGVWRRIRRNWLQKVPPQPEVKSLLPQKVPIESLEFPATTTPLVSIVIPVFNKSEYTYHCLRAVLANTEGVDYEVIVVDDCSTDDTAAMLDRLEGLSVLRNDSNSGFIHSCNRGAQAARGEYLLFLNNDTEVQPGWLKALVQTFTDFPDAGMAGARLLFADRSLQEAGGIVWRDGSAWNYGRGKDPNLPQYSYARQVDYCSGACLLLPRDAFMRYGMFDTLYVPAYYEDTDLAFKVRASGKQVIYQPLAQVVHFEGVTCGTDIEGGIKEYQRINQQKFLQRWQEVLQLHRPNGIVPEYEKERKVQKRALVVDALVITPDRDSGSLRMFMLLKILQKLDYKVTFVGNLAYDTCYTPLLQSQGIECLYAPYVDNLHDYLQHSGKQYQLVILSRADIADQHIDDARSYCTNALVLFDTVDLHFLREQREAELTGSSESMAAAELRRNQELGIARKADCTLVVSQVELELFRETDPDIKVALLSNIHELHGRQAPYPERRNILFIGSFNHPPNPDAMHWFIDEVMPLLQERSPGLKLIIVGGNVPKSLLAKAGPNIEFTGFVADIEPLFNSVRLSVAPLRYGAGVKGKINSSMSYGVPVVATSVAAEGMHLQHGENVMIADSASAFADCILQVNDDENLWYRLSDGGMENIRTCFSPDVAKQQLQEVLGEP